MDKYALICEDNLTTAYCIKSMLEKLNFKTVIAQSAEETIELLKKQKYDLLTLDILLPDKNGLDIVEEIKNIEIAKDLPIIVISALPQENVGLKNENNVVYWIKKSFDMENFEDTVKNIIKESTKNKINLLHVENDKDLLSLIEITLSDIANVTQVSNLAEAKRILETNQFDIIILDYVFPEGTSDKLIPTIKSGVNKTAKVIMFSAYEENKILERYVDEIIIKTNVSFDEFKACIEKYID